mgnify:CR=1 FL=1
MAPSCCRKATHGVSEAVLRGLNALLLVVGLALFVLGMVTFGIAKPFPSITASWIVPAAVGGVIAVNALGMMVCCFRVRMLVYVYMVVSSVFVLLELVASFISLLAWVLKTYMHNDGLYLFVVGHSLGEVTDEWLRTQLENGWGLVVVAGVLFATTLVQLASLILSFIQTQKLVAEKWDLADEREAYEDMEETERRTMQEANTSAAFYEKNKSIYEKYGLQGPGGKRT